MIIYRALNTINGKSYIGLTTLDLGQRKHKHWLNSRNPDKNKKQAFYLAINKYGWESFEWQELCSCLNKKDLSELEKQFIKEYDTYNNGYNNTVGGEGVDNPKKLEKYIVRFPDQTVHIVEGWKKFCREHNLNEGNLWHTYNPYKRTYTIKGKHYTYWMKAKACKGYVLLGKFNDYLGTEYIQVDGSGGLQAEINACLDDDIVFSNEQSLAGTKEPTFVSDTE
jgi:hypothetical protein